MSYPPPNHNYGMPHNGWNSLSDEQRIEYARLRRREASYRTRICREFRVNGYCSYGDNCRFAHSESDLNLPPAPHPRSNTSLCRNFSESGFCPYGSRCQFVHRRAPPSPPSYPSPPSSPRVPSPAERDVRDPNWVERPPVATYTIHNIPEAFLDDPNFMEIIARSIAAGANREERGRNNFNQDLGQINEQRVRPNIYHRLNQMREERERNNAHHVGQMDPYGTGMRVLHRDLDNPLGRYFISVGRQYVAASRRNNDSSAL